MRGDVAAFRARSADLADEHTACLDVGVERQGVADAVGAEVDLHDLRERLVVHRDRDVEEQRQHHEEDQSQGAATQGRSGRVAHPATLTVVVVPQIARLRKKSRIAIVTIAVRTARPTATPTPAGPPLAWKP